MSRLSDIECPSYEELLFIVCISPFDSAQQCGWQGKRSEATGSRAGRAMTKATFTTRTPSLNGLLRETSSLVQTVFSYINRRFVW